MNRNLKAFGLALVAAFAMSALAASAAQATQASFTAASYPAVVKGSDEGATNFFRITGPEGSKTECVNAVYEGTLSAASTTLTVTPHYEECESVGNESHVLLNGCHYLFHAGTKTSTSDVHGTVDVVCPPNQEITINVTDPFFGSTVCQVHIPPQTGLGKITYTNLGGDQVTVHVDVTGITYTHTDISGFCPFAGGGHFSDGEFSSDVLLTGTEDKGSEAHATTSGRTTYKVGTKGLNVHVK